MADDYLGWWWQHLYQMYDVYAMKFCPLRILFDHVKETKRDFSSAEVLRSKMVITKLNHNFVRRKVEDWIPEYDSKEKFMNLYSLQVLFLNTKETKEMILHVWASANEITTL